MVWRASLYSCNPLLSNERSRNCEDLVHGQRFIERFRRGRAGGRSVSCLFAGVDCCQLRHIGLISSNPSVLAP